MTCIVAATNGTKVFMAADSCAVDETSISSRKTPKIFIKGSFLLGYCQSFRLGQIAQYAFDPPALPTIKLTDDVLTGYMVKNFVPALKKCLEENNFPYHDDDKDDWEIIIGIKGRIFVVENDWQVGLDIHNYWASGAGAHIALGALFACEDMEPNARLMVALNAAKEFSPFVREPFNFLSV
jgi:hypothetical protein